MYTHRHKLRENENINKLSTISLDILKFTKIKNICDTVKERRWKGIDHVLRKDDNYHMTAPRFHKAEESESPQNNMEVEKEMHWGRNL